MKIGLACSGSGLGACEAYVLAQTLEAMSLHPEMISCTSLSAAPLLLWSRGVAQREAQCRIKHLIEGDKTTEDLQLFCAQLPAQQRCRLAINSVDCETGGAVIWADGLSSSAWNWQIHPLCGAEVLALQCSMDAAHTRGCKNGNHLIDFSCRYGCPFFPLRMAGAERILSVTFTGGHRPADAAGECLCALTGKYAHLHYSLRVSPENSAQEIRDFLHAHQSELYAKLLF